MPILLSFRFLFLFSSIPFRSLFFSFLFFLGKKNVNQIASNKEKKMYECMNEVQWMGWDGNKR